MKIFIYETSVFNPYYNLAVEDALCNYVSSKSECKENICGIFIWQSDNAIVIGRNQNPYRECNMEAVRKHNIKIVRRFTGGGAVYHDLGNINYSFISSESTTSTANNLEIVQSALKKLGVKTIISGRNDITTPELQKISGTAQKKYKHAFLHHGTLLVSLNKEMANLCLTPDQFKLSNKSIHSVKSRIININDIIPSCRIADVKQQLRNEFMLKYNDAELFKPHYSENDFQKSYQILIDKRWIMGKDISNFWIIQKTWGTIRFCITEQKGYIVSISYETDAIEIDFISDFFSRLQGIELNKNSLANTLKSLNSNGLSDIQYQIATDLIEKIMNEIQEDINGTI